MSYQRIILRVVLVLLLVGIVGTGIYLWRRSDPNYYRTRAEAAIEREDYQSAHTYLVRLLEMDPNDSAAHESISRVILEEARKNNAPASYAAQPIALEHLARAAELAPEDISLKRRLLRAYLQQKDIAKAAPLAETVYAQDKRDGDAHLALLWQAVNDENAENAQHLIDDMSGVESRHPYQEFALKMEYFSGKSDTNSKQAWEKTIDDAVSMASTLSGEQLELLSYRDREVMLLVLLVAQANSDGALKQTSAARAISHVVDGLKSKDLIAADLADSTSAHSRALLDGDFTTDSDRRRQIDRALWEHMRPKAPATDAVEQNPASLAAYGKNARSLFSLGSHAEAIRILNKGISAAETMEGEQVQAQEAELRLLAARILMFDGEYEQAKDHLDKLAPAPQLEGWRHLLRGNMAIRNGELNEALAELNQADVTLEKSIQVDLGLARVYMGRQEWELAIGHLESVLVADDELSYLDRAWRTQHFDITDRVQLDLLRARLQLGQWSQAQEQLLALRETEFAPRAWEAAVQFLYTNGQEDKAWAYLGKAREKFSDDVNLVFTEADMLRQEDKGSRAQITFEDFVAAKPEDPVRRLAMARWQIASGEPQAALVTLDRVREFPELDKRATNTLRVLTAQADLYAGQLSAADSGADTLIAASDTIAVGYLMKSLIHAAQGESAESDEWLAKAHAASGEQVGEHRCWVKVPTPDGRSVGAAMLNAYYW